MARNSTENAVNSEPMVSIYCSKKSNRQYFRPSEVAYIVLKDNDKNSSVHSNEVDVYLNFKSGGYLELSLTEERWNSLLTLFPGTIKL